MVSTRWKDLTEIPGSEVKDSEQAEVQRAVIDRAVQVAIAFVPTRIAKVAERPKMMIRCTVRSHSSLIGVRLVCLFPVGEIVKKKSEEVRFC